MASHLGLHCLPISFFETLGIYGLIYFLVSSGSNNSIPDLVRQLSSEKLQTRPASASTRKSKPPSGKKPRPQSAKEPLPTQTHDAVQTFGGR